MLDNISTATSGSLANFDGTFPTYCSLKLNTKEERANFFNAVTIPDNRISNLMNTTFKLKDIFIESVSLKTEEGEIIEAPRIILFDVDGSSCACTSMGVYKSILKLVSIYGPPSWEDGISIMFLQIKSGVNTVFSFKVV